MSVIEVSVFAGVLLTAAFLSVFVRSLLYAVFFQIQSVVAAAALLAGLNAQAAGFALVSMSAAALAAFLIFALIVFDGEKRVPPESGKASLLLLALTGGQAAWLFFKTGRTAGEARAAFPAFGAFPYERCGLCAAAAGTVLLACLIGLATLTAAEDKKK